MNPAPPGGPASIGVGRQKTTGMGSNHDGSTVSTSPTTAVGQCFRKTVANSGRAMPG
ncbi:MAG: hypothetical protein AVDCRST_MAG08-1051 [uncultured Acetobacteraceae bacterium]|uniref:Uncharacterized protein n=1 Tax=uncultured Acetobacteraceae bacterium TaxID=169975 RepID=A0A6J4HPY8_9PROT|nr:MAG: hypothetical protein AVDCRST_MAG08-1051 [uncultured Acetobacteraceae bacterium]